MNNYLSKVLFTIGFIFTTQVNTCQNKRLDSLIHLSKIAKDTLEIRLLNEISWDYKNSNLDSALYYGKSALKKSLFLKHKKSIAKSYNSIGSVFQAKSYPDSAIHYHKKSLQLKKEIKDSVGIADTYNNIGIILDEQGDYSDALRNYFDALYIYEKKSTKFDQIPAVLVNIGIVYKKQKKFDEVLKYYQKALTIYEKNNFEIGIVITTGNIGSVFLKIGKYQKAIEYCKKARKLYADLGYKRYVPYMNVNIASAEYHLKEYPKSRDRFLDVIKKFKNDNNLYELANAKIGISRTYIEINQYRKANKELNEALVISKTNSYKEFEVDALKLLSKVHLISKNFKEAYSYQEKYHEKKDSLFELKKVKNINELSIKYETSKKEKEILQQKEELLAQELSIKNRDLYATLLASALIVLAILFFAIYKRNQLKRKQLQKEIDLKDALSIIKMQNRLQEQRLRISRDLHDNIGSQLTFIISSVDNLKYISKDTNEKLKEKLAGISSFTSKTIHQLRDTIWAMNKSEISNEDLQTRILSFVEKAKTATNNNIHFEVLNDASQIQFTSIQGINVFRLIQEAINNSLKYANASKIIIETKKVNNLVTVIVSDNGKGFNLNSIQLGNGLSNMEKRMTEINGTVSINSELKKGTTITSLIKI